MERQSDEKNTERKYKMKQERLIYLVGDLKGEMRNNTAEANIRKDCC